ncbi:MAG: GpE family phage tail protein [Rhizomicrobium sp.]
MAAVFHWPPSEMDAMTIADLINWQKLAIDRFKRMNG